MSMIQEQLRRQEQLQQLEAEANVVVALVGFIMGDTQPKENHMASREDRELAAAVVMVALDDDNLDDIRKSLKRKLRKKLPRWFPIGRILRYVLPALRDEIEGILLGDEEE